MESSARWPLLHYKLFFDVDATITGESPIVKVNFGGAFSLGESIDINGKYCIMWFLIIFNYLDHSFFFKIMGLFVFMVQI